MTTDVPAECMPPAGRNEGERIPMNHVWILALFIQDSFQSFSSAPFPFKLVPWD